MIKDIDEVMDAPIAEPALVQEKFQAQERALPPASGTTTMLLASPFDKLPQDQGKVVQAHSHGITLVSGMPAVASLPAPQEADLWMSGGATLLGMAVLLAALRSVWE